MCKIYVKNRVCAHVRVHWDKSVCQLPLHWVVMNLPTSWRLIKTYAKSCGLKQTWAVGRSFACHLNQLTACEAWIFKSFCRNVLFLLMHLHFTTWVFLRSGFLGAQGGSNGLFFYQDRPHYKCAIWNFIGLPCWNSFRFSSETVELYIGQWAAFLVETWLGSWHLRNGIFLQTRGISLL